MLSGVDAAIDNLAPNKGGKGCSLSFKMSQCLALIYLHGIIIFLRDLLFGDT